MNKTIHDTKLTQCYHILSVNSLTVIVFHTCCLEHLLFGSELYIVNPSLCEDNPMVFHYFSWFKSVSHLLIGLDLRGIKTGYPERWRILVYRERWRILLIVKLLSKFLERTRHNSSLG